jgi:nicotinamidase-related amidase
MTTVLLLLDIQAGVVELLDQTKPYLDRVAATVASARKANIKIIHVKTGFRPGYPENNPNNSSISAVAERGRYIEGDPSVELHSAIIPTDKEVVLTKRRVSAFFSTELDLLLRCANAKNLVVAGLVTSGAVLSTVCQALDLDYRVTVLENCCMDRDDEIHRVLMEKYYARKTKVVSAEEWVESLGPV